ncbi:MAG: T9SS type A sorting domain-containing protein [Lewinellaceae bacterium]|nr:T9SS type A sorting domain-containing protein [Lewinellaceae bacterium]
MKRMLLAVFSALCFGASAQITVTASTFPSAGDTLRYAVDANVSGIPNIITPPGGNQLWIFTDLQADQNIVTPYLSPTAGVSSMSFPGADLLVLSQTGESYFNKTSNVVELMGYAGADPANFNLNVLAKFSPAIIERRSPMNFFDVNQQESFLSIPFSTAQLPDTLFAGLPIAPDSIRIRINTSRLDVVDAWGECAIPGGQYPVLRLKRSEFTTTALDVKVPFLGWIDLSTLIGGGGGGGGLGGFLGTDTTYTFHFFNNVEKEEIAVVTASNDLSTVESIRFKDNGVVSADEDPNAPGKVGVAAFPNPAVDWVRFDCTNLPKADYTLKIFNIVGKVVWREDYALSGNKSIRVDLEDFKKGTYLYSLSDQDGNVIGTKRLVVLKP